MDVFRQGSLRIFWGDKQSCPLSKESLEFKNFCQTIAHNLRLDGLSILYQEHGIEGLVVDKLEPDNVSIFDKSGDWLVTDQVNVGLGVLTADCLPIIFYNSERNVTGIAHTGWRGTVKNIMSVVVDVMQRRFDVDPKKMQVFFGPAAGSCCYEVSPDFWKKLPVGIHVHDFIQMRDGKYFFDNVLLCTYLLVKSGIVEKNIKYQFNVCTMCDQKFHSYRRDKGLERNITIVYKKLSIER